MNEADACEMKAKSVLSWSCFDVDSLLAKSHLNLNVEANQRNDNISHWVLRLAFSQNEELRRRFLQFECFLFKRRFEKQSPRQIQEFMLSNNVGLY